jgi:hypothetical protein
VAAEADATAAAKKAPTVQASTFAASDTSDRGAHPGASRAAAARVRGLTLRLGLLLRLPPALLPLSPPPLAFSRAEWFGDRGLGSCGSPTAATTGKTRRERRSALRQLVKGSSKGGGKLVEGAAGGGLAVSANTSPWCSMSSCALLR